MRKLFLFLLVFGAGFAVLYYIDRSSESGADSAASETLDDLDLPPGLRPPGSQPADSQAPDSQPPGQESPAGGAAGEGAHSQESPAADQPQVAGDPPVGAGESSQPDPSEGGPEGQGRGSKGGARQKKQGEAGISVVQRGELQFSLSDVETGGKVHDFHFEHLEPLEDGFYDAHGVEIRTYDPLTGVLQMTYDAARARLKVEQKGTAYTLGDKGKVLLYDVLITQHTGSDWAPMRFQLPAAEARIRKERQSFRSVDDSEVHVHGNGLEARGKGLQVNSELPFRLSRGGIVHLDTPKAGRVMFSTPKGGEILIESLGPVGEQAVELRALGGALLEIEGKPPKYPQGQIESVNMTLFGRVLDGDFLVESSMAFGGVRAEFGRDRFEGEEARSTFDEEGRLASLLLSGDPSARLAIEGPEGEDVLLLSKGSGDLLVEPGQEVVVKREDGTEELLPAMKFRQAGPARLRAPDLGLVIDAQKEIGGDRVEGEDSGGFFATEGVSVRQERRVLTTSSITGRLMIRPEDPDLPNQTREDRIEADAVCRGRTHFFDGTDEKRQLDVLSDGRFEFKVRGPAWYVPFAQGVQLAVEGEQPYTAKAKVLREYDSDAGTFSAEGDVEFANVIGVARAVRARALDRENMELYGLPGNPARFEVHTRPDMLTLSGVFDALQIDANPERVVVREEVHGKLFTGDREFQVEADWAEVTLDDAAGVAVDVREKGRSTEGREPSVSRESAQGGDQDPRPFRLRARGVKKARATQTVKDKPKEILECACDELVVTGSLAENLPETRVGEAPASRDYRVLESELVATGNVRVDYQQAFELEGYCERFTLNDIGQGRMEGSRNPGEKGRKVTTEGKMADDGLPYRMTSDEVLFDDGYLEAEAPRVFLEAPLLPIVGNDPRGGFTRAEAERMRGDAQGVLFQGKVRVEGTDRAGKQLILESEALRLSGKVKEAARGAIQARQAIHSIDAWGGFTAVYEEDAEAAGEAFNMTKDRLLVTGHPGEPAMFGIDDYVVVSEFIKLDLHTFLLSTAQGYMTNERGLGDWRMEFASIQPQRDGGDSILVISQPISQVGTATTTRAAWAVIWVKADVWTRHGLRMLWTRRSEREGEQKVPTMPRRDLVDNPFRGIVEADLERFFHQIYLEGDVETLREGQRVARAESLLLDLRENTGWMREAQVEARVEVGDKLEPLFVSSEELRMRADGVLIAEDAKVTACDHADPHYTVEVGRLELEPRVPGKSKGWRFSAHGNMLNIGDMLQLPLPPLGRLVLDDQGDVEGFETSEGDVLAVDSLFMGSSRRYGTSVGTGVRTDIGKVGSRVGRLLGFKKNEVDGHWDFDAHYMDSRGLLLGVGLELRDKVPGKSRDEEAWLDLYAAGIADSDQDRGFVRVDPDDRSSFRSIVHGYGRYPVQPGEWFGVSFVAQSDPGVQSEFFENTFENYELREDYVHWRKARGSTFYDADLQVRSNGFRTEVERLPSAGFYSGARPIADLGRLSLLYSTSLDADYLRRREGTLGEALESNVITGLPSTYTEFFEEQFTDGLGDREVLRLDNVHRLEAPFSVGDFGLRMNPYLEGRLSGWDRDALNEEEAGRAALFAGLDLATTFWKRSGKQFQSITPSFGFRGTVVEESTEALPVRFDAVEESIEGNMFEVGLRYTWQGTKRRGLDLEMRVQHLSDQGVDVYDRDFDGDTGDRLADEERLLVLSNHRFDLFGVPFATRLDGRYDWQIQDSNYLRAVLGFAAHPDVPVELSYTQGPRKEHLGAGIDPDPLLPPIDAPARTGSSYEGLDPDERLFQAIGARVRWTINPKWEVELRETLSLRDDDRLNSRATLRRFGHDLLVEFSAGFRQDEGSNVTVTFRPLLGWTKRPLGILRQ